MASQAQAHGSSAVEKTKVAIVGLGTVGSGVARLLVDYGDRTTRHAGRTIWLEKVVVQDPNKERDYKLPAGLLSDDLRTITNNREISAVAHLVGGLEPARSIMVALLESGKDVVTANKALLAEHGPELFDLARELGRSIAFEAAVAGGIPIIANISQCLSANQIESLTAILNGTSNYILTQMEERGADYAGALAEAQRLGYAEADPAMDVDGTDTAQKLAILAHLAFGARVHWRDIPRQGIDGLEVIDIKNAQELGYRIKLLAVAELAGDGLELHVSPTLVKVGTPLAEVRGAFNAIRVVGDAVGPVFFHGLGAGRMPTASAVVADLIDTVVGRTSITFRTLELWSQREARVSLRDPKKIAGRFYLRLNVEDRPGVMAEITGLLGRRGISIASVIQREPPTEEQAVVSLVIITHDTVESATVSAMDEIDRLKCVRPGSVRMRILD
ncbi:MAG TPA: homoserine dehydrogenase [Pirellulales bacterium]|jgi:homoserine dehydrogenase|nr:homoserine dehydrogenase [Pirellulales bacterium]